MAVYRCNQCGLIKEEITLPAGGKIDCAGCSTKVTLFPAAFYLQKLFDRYLAIRRELETLRRQEDESESDPNEDTAHQDASPAFHAILKDTLQNTMLLATAEQHQPLQAWFASRDIKTTCDHSLVDTSGFFDEAATLIGDHYDLVRSILEQLRYGYNKDWTWLNIDLGKKSRQDKQALKALFRELYSYTFFAKYVFQKQKDAIGLGLQPALPIRQFLTGGWLEWWVFIRLLEFCLENSVAFSCARGMTIAFDDGEKRELDVVFILKINEQDYPVIVECKTGEFRGELQKYSALKKRLKIDDEQFVICNPDLDEGQAAGLSTMYGLTFVNLGSLAQRFHAILEA